MCARSLPRAQFERRSRLHVDPISLNILKKNHTHRKARNLSHFGVSFVEEDMFRNKRPASCVAAALAVALTDGCSRSSAEPHTRGDPVVPVLTSLVEKRAVPVSVHAVGSVEPMASVAILSRVDGPIERVLVADGQDVKAGEPLVQVDPEPLRIQVRMNEANLQRDVAKEEDAKAKEGRGRALLDQHFISPDGYAQLKSNLDSATATVASDRAILDQAKLQLTYTTIRAPVAGKIGHIALQTGNMLHAASTEPLTTLNVLDTVDVSFTVPERSVQAVRRAAEAHQAMVTVTETDAPPLVSGAAIAVPTAAISKTTSAPAISSALTFIDNTVDRQTGTLRLRARMDNKSHALWPGEFVAVNLSVGIDNDATVVPSVAVQPGPKGTYVFVVRQDLSVEQRPVQVTRVADDLTLVSGVQPGERVVIDGASRLTPGMHVSVRADGGPART
jgi:membrane fusion protein, multidrug efflux system